MNKCIFIGRVGKDPEVRSLQNGNQVANFSLAVSERYKDKDGNKQEVTEWVNVVCFNKGLITIIQNYATKGSQIMICGKMKTRSWDDNNGVKKYMTEIVLDAFNGEIELLGGKQDGQQNAPKKQEPAHDDFEDSIPY